MQMIRRLVISAFALSITPLAYADCTYPAEVNVPDGSTATSDEMVDSQTRVKQYMSDMEAYLACLDREETELGREPTAEEKQLHNQRHNAAVDAMEKVAADFNEQVRAYKKQSR